MNPEIFDLKDGIRLVFPMETGFALSVDMTDEAADQMCKIIRNKLNARLE